MSDKIKKLLFYWIKQSV